jgi:hypothetical protein
MIPDTARIHITADDFRCFGFSIPDCQVEGYAYSRDDEPVVDVVTWIAPGGMEIQMSQSDCFAPMDKAVCEALWDEARTPLNASRLHQAFVDHAYDSAVSARGDHLRVVAAE